MYEETQHPILRHLLDHRSLHKMLTGFVEALHATAAAQYGRQVAARSPGGGRRPPPDVIRWVGTLGALRCVGIP